MDPLLGSDQVQNADLIVLAPAAPVGKLRLPTLELLAAVGLSLGPGHRRRRDRTDRGDQRQAQKPAAVLLHVPLSTVVLFFSVSRPPITAPSATSWNGGVTRRRCTHRVEQRL